MLGNRLEAKGKSGHRLEAKAGESYGLWEKRQVALG